MNSALTAICQKISERDDRSPLAFDRFIDLAREEPERVFRNIFQVFYDMIECYVGEGKNEYPDDPESINYVYYDCSRLFEEGSDHPFFADRLFANRLINHLGSFKRGIQQNGIYIFEGPHGCGKSTFLNNLLMKFEQFARSDAGAIFETVWRLDKKELGSITEHETQAILNQLRSLVDHAPMTGPGSLKNQIPHISNKEFLEVPCPSHDHPLLIIPKSYRKEFFNGFIRDDAFKEKLFSEKQYEWIFRDNPCTICMSLYETLIDLLDSPSRVFKMLYARRYPFNRRLGEGISVFNPGDRIPRENVITNQLLQSQLNRLLKDSNRVHYIFSRYAKTNNGIYALMDIKDHNKERFANLHGIISEGVHKVEDIEENVNSLFLALMNPEDKGNIGGTQSFSDRIINIKIPYVLDYNTEVKIYKNVFGDQIEKHFLPRILENFAKVIISTRLKPRSENVLEWIGNPDKYELFCDRNLLLLKMDIYVGLIPPWLSEEDRKQFNAKRRRTIIDESEFEGTKGFSGRDSIKIFNAFYSTYAQCDKLITMANICSFFKKHQKELSSSIPQVFLDSLVRFYNYTVLQEVKESLYYYNEERISRDIQNYLFAVNFEIGSVERSAYTGEMITITEDFFEEIERKIVGPDEGRSHRINFRKDIQKEYASQALTQEMIVEGRALSQTHVYQDLQGRYVHNLKEQVMDPFLENDNFRRAIKDFDRIAFKTYDKRIRDEVTFLMKNLNNKYGYSMQGAKEVCMYVVDNEIAKTFSEK